MIFREEKHVIVNGKNISKNGFKNLSFETSKYSGSFSASRGFGTFLNESNLSQVDVFNIEFIITKDELPLFAKMYAEFRAFGVLPIENEYILNKIKNTLSYQKSFINLRIEEETKKKKLKEIKYINVFLESMRIKSLERTSNGYEVALILSLNRFGFSNGEYEKFKLKFNEWDIHNDFSNICEKGINKNSEIGGIELEYFSIEKLNAKQKDGLIMQVKDEYFNEDSKEDILSRSQMREEILKSTNDINKSTKIFIPEKNILQIELILNNNISNLPLYGEPIGLKSFMGLGNSTFIAKMIFDESDSEILNELKSISDKDTTKTIMNIKNFLPNMIDLNSASINKIYFNNTEQANGVMVTILFELNSYFYDMNMLIDPSNVGESQNKNSINTTSSYEHIESLNDTDKNNLITTSFWLENTAQQLFMEKQISDITLDIFLETPIEGFSLHEDGKTLTTLENTKKAFFHSFNIEDYLKSYTSYITRFDESSFVKNIEEFNKYLNIKTPVSLNIRKFSQNNDGGMETLNPETIILNKFKMYINKNDYKEMFPQDMVNSPLFYNYFDGISIVKYFGSDYIQKSFNEYFNEIDNEEVNSINSFVNHAVKEIFNSNTTRENLMVLNMKRFFYASYLANIQEAINSKKIETKDFITSNGIDFIGIKKQINELYEYNINNFSSSIESELLFDESITFVIESMKKDRSDNEENLKESEEMISVFNLNKELLQKDYEKFVKEFKNIKDFTMNSNKDIAYNIFLTKLNYAFSKDISGIDFTNNAEINKYINALVLSSSLMSFLLVKISGMTCNFGFISKNISNNIGYKLNTFLYMGESKYGKEETIKECFHKFKSNAYYEDKVNFYPWLKKDTKDNVNKDYNYFFGTKIIKNCFGIFESCLENNNSVFVSDTIDEFLEKKKDEFINSKSNTEKIENVISNKNYPTSHVSDFFENINEKIHINNRMKKRIIGNLDPFNVISKLKKIMCYVEQESIPDYKVIIGNIKQSNDNQGIFNDNKVINYLELTNIAEIKISKNPKNKIKSAKIILLDFNKQLINYGNRNVTIPIKIKKDNEFEIFEIMLGDHINIELGYGENQKNVFNGYISSINNNGNIIEINSSGFASSLYSNVIKKINFSENGVLRKIFDFTKLGVKAITTISPMKEVTKSHAIFQKFIQRHELNSHLFHFEKLAVETYGEEQEKNLSLPNDVGAESSMFMIFTKILALLPKNVKDVIGGYTISSGSSVLLKKIIEDNKDSLGNSKEGQINDINGNSNIYKNIFNVDEDYDNYGIQTIVEVTEIEKKEPDKSDNPVVQLPNPFPVPIPPIPTEKIPTDLEIELGVTHKYMFNSNMSNEYFENKDKLENKEIYTKDFIFPTDSKRITSNYSKRRFHPIKKKWTQHNGIDIGSEKRGVLNHKDYIYASKDGIVEASNYSKTAGHLIIINHGNNERTRYLHLDKRFVKPGQKVKKGQKIGLMGNTGASAGKHLHFEIRIGNIAKNPMDYLKVQGGETV